MLLCRGSEPFLVAYGDGSTVLVRKVGATSYESSIFRAPSGEGALDTVPFARQSGCGTSSAESAIKYAAYQVQHLGGIRYVAGSWMDREEFRRQLQICEREERERVAYFAAHPPAA